MKPRNPLTGDIEEDVIPEATEPKPRKLGGERERLSVKLATQRHERLLLQNRKLREELSERRGGLVSLEDIKRDVVNANHTVKQHLLALPDRLAPQLVALDVHQIRTLLHREIVAALNELAYEHQGT